MYIITHLRSSATAVPIKDMQFFARDSAARDKERVCNKPWAVVHSFIAPVKRYHVYHYLGSCKLRRKCGYITVTKKYSLFFSLNRRSISDKLQSYFRAFISNSIFL